MLKFMDGLYSRISNSICIPVSVGVWYQIGRIRDPTDRPTDDEHEDEEHCSGEKEKEEEELRKKKNEKEKKKRKEALQTTRKRIKTKERFWHGE